MAKTAVHQTLKSSNRQRLRETQGYIDRVRSMLLAQDSRSFRDTLTRVKGEMAESRKAKSAR
jgi:hypothetical protein